MYVYAIPYQSLMYLIILNRMCFHKGYCYASVCAFSSAPVDNGCCQNNLCFYNDVERTFGECRRSGEEGRRTLSRSSSLTVQLKSLRSSDFTANAQLSFAESNKHLRLTTVVEEKVAMKLLSFRQTLSQKKFPFFSR